MSKLFTFGLVTPIVVCFVSSVYADESTTDPRSNILLIVADDLGYADLGVYGSEISTPTLDALAESGVQLTNFHADQSCSPSRARLMSGTDNHLAGLGAVLGLGSPNEGKPGYEGYLNSSVVTLPELLADAGYHTYMTGKWHLGFEPEQSPSARGFEKTFALLGGGAHHFTNMSVYGPDFAGTETARYRANGEMTEVPENFYSTRFFTEKMIEFIESQRATGKPFFAYLAYTAPHWPLQAPEESIAKYRGRYNAGYDVLHEERIARIKELGLIDQDALHHPRHPDVPVWETLSDEEKKVEARKMEIYAAMVDDMDRYVAHFLDYLKDIGEYENTLIVFMSDNGPEPRNRLHGLLLDWYNECCDHSYENMGKPDSWVIYGPPWARAGAGHLRDAKFFVSEGGVRVPAIVHHPLIQNPGTRNDGFTTIMDLLPTFLDVAETEHPGTEYKGRAVLPLKGESLWPALTGVADSFHGEDYFAGWETSGRGAVIQGDWKLLLEAPPFGNYDFQLYNISEDPGEVNDLAEVHPEKYEEMIQLWLRYRDENGVIPVEPGSR